MKSCLLIFLIGISQIKPKALITRQRQPRLGTLLDEIDINSLEPTLKVLRKSDIEKSTNEIKQRIQQINERLSQAEKNEIILEADQMNPVGFECENQVLDVKEVIFVEQVRCYKTTEEVCSTVKYSFLQGNTSKMRQGSKSVTDKKSINFLQTS